MPANRVSASPGKEPAAATPESPAAAPGTAAAEPARGGLAAWLPLALTVVLMPAMAYVTTTFLLIPRIQKATSHAAPGPPTTSGTHAPAKGHGGGGETREGAIAGLPPRYTAPIEKVLVNVAGSMGTRYLLTKLTLVSNNADLKKMAEKNEDMLRDLAMSALSSKTINDLEKPGARNLIRSELISLFNSALGSGVIQEIYFTEFAVQ
jgi:flagellar FliL protein